jgi:hypothetical protein
MEYIKFEINANGFKEPVLKINIPFADVQIWEMEAVRHPFYTVVGRSREDCFIQAKEQQIKYMQVRN